MNFIHKLLQRAFEMGEYIAEDNKYEDENIPYNWWEVAVVGYNSAKFDMNLLLKELECDSWHIQSRNLMITETNLKHVHVKRSKENKEDKCTDEAKRNDLTEADDFDDETGQEIENEIEGKKVKAKHTGLNWFLLIL
jgi:hypothetical protein